MQKYKFQRQIMFKNIIIVILVIVVLMGIGASYIFHTSERSFEKQYDVQFQGVASQLDGAILLADEIALQLAANNTIIRAFQGIQDYNNEKNFFLENDSLNYEMKQQMMSYILKANSIGRISVFDDRQNYTFVGRAVDYGYLKKDCPQQIFFQNIKRKFDEKKSAVLFLTDMQDMYVKESQPVISVIREIKNYQLIPSQRLGYVQVQIPFSKFKKMESILGEDTECFVFSQKESNLLFSLNTDKKTEEAKKLLENSEQISGKSLYVRKCSFPEYGIKVLLVSHNTRFIKELLSTIALMAILIICTILVMWVGQLKVIRKTTEPIVQLCELLESLHADENLREIPTIVSAEDDELRQLNLAFDELVRKLRNSIEKNMTSRINEIQSQMFALQTQMNPHFIHNILTVVSAMAESEECRKVPEVCEKLSDMIRYNTNGDSNYTNLEEEIRHAENYLELMKIRYEDKFQYSMVYAGNLQVCRLPRFVIQPLLENVFTHGFKGRDFPWIINIRIFASDENWEVEVSDNGTGIQVEKLDALNHMLENIRKQEPKDLMRELRIGGLSLKNVYARLYLAYEKKMIFRINSNEAGTKVVIGGSYDNTCDGGRG